jgi:hypothetical protein
VYIRVVSGDVEHPQSPTPDDEGITRRRFVGTGVAVGAAIVWTGPFAEAALGKVLSNGPVTGTTGTTGPATSTGTTTTTTTQTGVGAPENPPAPPQPSQHFQFPAVILAHDGTLSLTAFLPSPGTLHVTATTETFVSGLKGVLAAARRLHKVKYASYSTVAHHRGLVHARIHPTKSGIALLARHRKHNQSLHIHVSATFRPVSGSSKTHEHTFRFSA